MKAGRIGVVGAGQMAEAMIGGWLKEELVEPGKIHASGPRPERAAYLKETYGILTTTDNEQAVVEADLILLTVKPQMMHGVLAGLKGKIKSSAAVLSIVAGVQIKTIQSELGHERVVRAMPNTPGMINEGMTIWTATADVDEPMREHIASLLAALGEQVFVEHERYLDMATALSGTGPMYVYLFMESLVDAGVRMGLPRYLAEQMVLQTVSGSVDYARATGRHLAQLRNEVTSPGGTSAEALFHLDQAGFRTAIGKAVHAAFEQSMSLGSK